MEAVDVNTDYHKSVDYVEKILRESVQAECPIRHFFVDGLYCREMTALKGTLLTSKIHKSTHPFILSKGKVGIVDGEMNPIVVEAPYFGITTPGTRRIIYVYEDSVWTTIHKTNVVPKSGSDEDLESAALLIENDIIQSHINSLIEKETNV